MSLQSWSPRELLDKVESLYASSEAHCHATKFSYN